MTHIGIISTVHNRLIYSFLKEIYKLNQLSFYLILTTENKKIMKKEDNILKERTGNFFFKKKNDLKKFKIPIYFVNSHNDKDTQKILKKNKIEYLYNAGTYNKISSQIIKKVKGIVNIHPGILPNYKGCCCPEWSLYNGDPVGLTAHFMNEVYDSGPIITRKYLKFKKKDIKSYHDIRIKIFILSFKLAKTIFRKLTKNKISIYKKKNIIGKYYKPIKRKYLLNIKKKISNKSYVFNKVNLIT
jgi:folate-dependent phosphoribosylglycinamide formyltransferase PurN